MLFTELHGVFPNDLPFDIDRHRATPFKITDKNAIISGIRLFLAGFVARFIFHKIYITSSNQLYIQFVEATYQKASLNLGL